MPDHRLTTAILAALQAVGAACHGDRWGGAERGDCSVVVVTYKVFPQQSTAPADLVAVTASSAPRAVFAVDVDGNLVARDDDALYRPIPHPATGTLRDVQFVLTPYCFGVECDPLAVIAVGDDGTVLRSEDLGATWSAISLATTADLRPAPRSGRIVQRGRCAPRHHDRDRRRRPRAEEHRYRPHLGPGAPGDQRRPQGRGRLRRPPRHPIRVHHDRLG